ncbi:MAG: hypothetical protein AAFY99_13010 [Pseudomonadota bacterium]
MRNNEIRNSSLRVNRGSILSGLAALLMLGGCALDWEPPGGPLAAEVQGTSPTATLQRVNERGYRCWIRSGDRAFAKYTLVPELDTRANDPRILIVEKDDARGLPILVISASGANPVQLTTFGSLADDSLSNRINADILAWSAGRTSCA